MRRTTSPILMIACVIGLFSGCGTVSRLRARGRVLMIKDVVYIAGSRNPKHRLDLYLPKGKTGFPVVHFVHGGSWYSGDKDYFAPLTGLYGSIGIALAKRGIGTVVQSYRLIPEAAVEGQIADILSALRWTLEEIESYGGDPGRVVLMGHSAGGHLTTLLGVDPRHYRSAGIDPDAIRGYVALSAIYDLGDMRANTSSDFNEELITPCFGSTEARLAKFSPITYITASLPPFLILIGEDDTPYIRKQTKTALEKLSALKNRHRFFEIPGFTHKDMVLKVGGRRDAVTPRVVEFVGEVTARL